MNHLLTITKSDGTKQLFEEEKLADSLRRAGAALEAIDEIVDEVEAKMKDGMTTDEIYKAAFQLLRKHSQTVAVKYSIRRALLELGPEGFPFERFVARMFQSWKYETLTDQTVLGSCISHEIDVVAWDAKKLIMVEAKFHNEFGLKSDSKVALYIQARREDLQEISFDYGGIKRTFSEFWLVTNTKFTDQAITYGGCKDLKMVGWNYPEKGNLHDLIDQNGLHPVTCLTLLTHQEKKDLIGRGVIVCIDLEKRADILKEIGVKEDRIAKIKEEAALIVRTAK